jgi:hypothetical protein
MRAIQVCGPVVACVLLMQATGCKPKLDSADASQDALATIALSNTNMPVRQAALQKLTNQTALARVVMEERLYGLIIWPALDKITDQAILAKIALEDQSHFLRRAAARKITDQTVLGKVAVKDDEYSVLWAAMNNLTNQSILAKVATDAKSETIRKAAAAKIQVANLTDLACLAKLAEGENPHIRWACALKITNQSVLAKIAGEDTDGRVNRAALNRITDQTLLAKLAIVATIGDEAMRICEFAAWRLTNTVLLAQVAVEARNSQARRAAVAKITDETILVRVALNDVSAKVGVDAVAKLTNETLLAKVIAEAQDSHVRQAAAEKIQSLRTKPLLKNQRDSGYSP